jgi:hypothetical protein
MEEQMKENNVKLTCLMESRTLMLLQCIELSKHTDRIILKFYKNMKLYPSPSLSIKTIISIF